jgi:hypothetical protein
MWTTNVVREIVRAEAIPLVPAATPRNDKEAVGAATAHLATNSEGVAVLKVHAPPPILDRSIGVVTLRDVRDATVSYMRFMRVPFERALHFAVASLRRPPEVLYPGEPRLLLDYTTITERPEEAVRYLAEQLGARRALEQSAEIAARFSKEAVKSLIDTADSDLRNRLRSGLPVQRSEMVVLSPDNWRVRDATTDFQTGHVSDYKSGDWAHILDEDQRAQLDKAIAEAGRALI